jgi:hypothetical protein
MIRFVTAFAAALAVASPCFAQTVVDRCTADNEPGGTRNLATALAQGGHITFACPFGSEIRMTAGRTVAPNTIIDGEGRVTLDAHGSPMTMFFVSGGSIELRDISIRNVRRQHSQLGSLASVVHATGDALFSNASIVASEGAVTIRGNAAVRDSEFLGNAGTALAIDGAGQVEQTRFIGNDTGLSIRTGKVHRSLFSENKTGALRVMYPLGKVEVVNSQFLRNDGRGAILLSQRSGAGAVSSVSIKRSKFSDNRNTSGGGAITIYDSTVGAPNVVLPALMALPPARFEIAYSSFTRNNGTRGGAISAELFNTDGLAVTGGIFIENKADDIGGAMAWTGRSIVINHSLFRGNTANRGSAAYGDFREGQSRWVMANSLVVENKASSTHAAIEVGPLELRNVTVANNSGFGFAADVHGSPAELPVVANSIISGNSEGNCRGVAASGFIGRNMQFGHRDCPNVQFEDPVLDALYVPALGSSALALGDVTICRAAPVSRRDIVFQSRATDDHCALGAFERPPIRRARPNREQ